MLVLIVSVVAGITVILFLAAITAVASSRTSRQPYEGTPAYHLFHQRVSIGGSSSESDWQQAKLTLSLEMKTGDGHVKYTAEGPPDAVLQNQPVMAMLATRMLQASPHWSASDIDANRAQVEAEYAPLAIPSSTYTT